MPSHINEYLLQIERILQFSAVVISDNQYDEFLSFDYTKKMQDTIKSWSQASKAGCGSV